MLEWAFMCFSPSLGFGCLGGGGSTKELVHNLLMDFVTLGISKKEVFQTYFLGHCDHTK